MSDENTNAAKPKETTASVFSNKLRDGILGGLAAGFLAILAAFLASGWLISALGGVTKEELREEIKKLAIGEDRIFVAPDDLAALVARIEAAEEQVIAFGTDVDDALIEAKEFNKTVSEVQAKMQTVAHNFHGAARISYFEDVFTFCKQEACPAQAGSSAPSQNQLSLSANGTRKHTIPVGETYGIDEEHFVLTVWSDIVENEFLDASGAQIEPQVKVAVGDEDVTLDVNVPGVQEQAYFRLQIIYIVAIQDSVFLPPDES